MSRTIPHSKAMAIIEHVAATGGLSAADLLERSRRPNIDAARGLAMRAVVDAYPGASVRTVARLFQRDHKTVLQALGRVRKGRVA